MIHIGLAGYFAVGLLYAIVGLLSFTSWRGGLKGGLLIAACVVSSTWAFLQGVHLLTASLSFSTIILIEVVRVGSWIVFLVAVTTNAVSLRLRMLIQIGWVLLLLASVYMWIMENLRNANPPVHVIMLPGILLASLAGLILIEQFYRNAIQEVRQKIKAIAIGLGGMFAYDLFLYSQGVLFGELDEVAWMARGAVNVFFVPLIAVAARRNTDWELDIFVSRHVVFYTGALIAVGVYLLLMSAGGYAILLYGGNWGGIARVVFLVGALFILVVMLFSNRLRAKFRVFLSKHFFSNRYDYREEWLRLTATLSDFEDSSTRQTVIKAMAQVVQSPGGVLYNLDDASRQYNPAATYATGSIAASISVDDPLARFIQEKGWIVDLIEYKQNPDHYDNVQVPDWLLESEEAWLVVPLVTKQRVPGLILLYRSPGPTKLNYEDRDLLKTVGHHIAVHLAQERSDSLLAEAQQFEAYNRLTAFLMHDLNNLIAQQSLIIKNAERHKRNPEFIDDAMLTIASSVDRMRRIMSQIKRQESDAQRKRTVLKFLVSTAADRCAGQLPNPQIELENMEVPVEVDPERFIMVLTHLIRNAQDATPDDGYVRVSAERSDSAVAVIVSDNGSGMTPEFVRERLFKPFDSTKGSQGMGIGVYQAREFARSLGGDLQVESSPGSGTIFRLSFPLER